MDPRALSNAAILELLGRRLRRTRLRADLAQSELARIAGVALRTVQNAEAGRSCSLDTLISILRALDGLAHLDAFLPEPELSPMDLVRRGGRERRRASPRRAAGEDLAG